jgi:hypothetical protein
VRTAQGFSATARPLDWELGQAKADMNDRSRFSNSSRIDKAMFGLLSLDWIGTVVW